MKDDHETREHPSYGTISVHKSQGGGNRHLFMSEIDSSTGIEIVVSAAEVVQNLGQDWVYSKRRARGPRALPVPRVPLLRPALRCRRAVGDR